MNAFASPFPIGTSNPYALCGVKGPWVPSGEAKHFTIVDQSAADTVDIKNWADWNNIQFVQLEGLSEEALSHFYGMNSDKERFRERLRRFCLSQEIDPVKRYDFEYATTSDPNFRAVLSNLFEGKELETALEAFERPMYAFWSALLDSASFEIICGKENLQMPGDVFDVGCGSGELENSLCQSAGLDKARIIGIDISNASAELLRSRGIRAEVGTLPDLQQTDPLLIHELTGSASTVFLSYFVDRDKNQAGTFDIASQILQSGGTLIFEGLLPVKPNDSGGTQYADCDTPSITSGDSAVRDMERIILYLDQKCGIQTNQIVVGQRLVFSTVDGFEILPSLFIRGRKR